MFLLGASDGEEFFSRPRAPSAASLKDMQTPVFEETGPADYLTRVAASDLGKAYKGIAVGEMAIRPGDVVLDLGCGPGADLPAFAEATGTSGRVLGIDHDPDAVRQARERTGDLPQVAISEGDIRFLGIPAASVDKVHTDRVLQHVPDPGAALAEARRALRDGGTGVFAEPDWDTLVIDYPDLATARAYTRYITDQVIRNPALGRQLPRLAAGVGFQVTRVTPITAVWREAPAADQVLGLQRVTGRAVTAGYLTQAAADQWLDYLATQPFFASTTLFITTAIAA
jgi:ubiquinone/menaquinone biosynthesis C-methylase UbiE